VAPVSPHQIWKVPTYQRVDVGLKRPDLRMTLALTLAVGRASWARQLRRSRSPYDRPELYGLGI